MNQDERIQPFKTKHTQLRRAHKHLSFSCHIKITHPIEDEGVVAAEVVDEETTVGDGMRRRTITMRLTQTQIVKRLKILLR